MVLIFLFWLGYRESNLAGGKHNISQRRADGAHITWGVRFTKQKYHVLNTTEYYDYFRGLYVLFYRYMIIYSPIKFFEMILEFSSMYFYIYASLGLKELNPASTPNSKSTHIDNWI